MKLLIKLTESHIKTSKRGTPTFCPVALAVKNVVVNSFVCVGHNYVNIDGVEHSLPRSAARFIKNFDLKKPVKPFNFILDLAAQKQNI